TLAGRCRLQKREAAACGRDHPIVSGLQTADRGRASGNEPASLGRRAAMRRVCELALVTLCLACTDGGPEPASLELAEPEPEHAPERERVVDPRSQPRLELVALEVDPDDGACPYEIEPRGFPAVADDGATLVDVYGFVPGNGDWTDAQMELSWLDAAGVRVERVYDRSEDWGASEEPSGCEQSLARVRERVATLNAELAGHTWRPLERLDALYSAPGFAASYE